MYYLNTAQTCKAALPHKIHRAAWLHALLIALPLTTFTTQVFAAANSLGPLSEFVQPRNDESWRVQDDGTSAYLENARDEGAITYYYVNSEPADEGNRTITVDVAFGSSTESSSAGLLYGYNDKPRSYFMFSVGGDSSIVVSQRIETDSIEIARIALETLSAAKTTLQIREQGQSVTLSVNGDELESFNDERLGRGGVGIVASDIGQYKFSNFNIVIENNEADKKQNTGIGGGFVMPDATPAEPAPKLAESNQSVEPDVPEKIKYFTDVDTSLGGMVSAYAPYPASWKQLKGNPEFYYEGPNGIKVSNSFGATFQFSTNQDGLQMLQMQGQQNTPPYSLQKIIDEFFMPEAKKTNRELVRTYPLPAYTQKMTEFQARLFKSVPVQETLESHALEWKDDKNLSYITVLTITVSQAFPISAWFAQGQYLVAQSEYFEQARDAFLYGLVHKETNPKWLQAVNQRDAQRAGRSWSEHNSRMNAIKARGQASQSIAKIYSEISDISHAGYLKRSDIQSHGHSASVRAVNEQSLIADHNTGEHYTVDGNQNHHWVNTNGVYIATDNALFDPRTDQQLNMFEWTKFQKEN